MTEIRNKMTTFTMKKITGIFLYTFALCETLKKNPDMHESATETVNPYRIQTADSKTFVDLDPYQFDLKNRNGFSCRALSNALTSDS